MDALENGEQKNKSTYELFYNWNVKNLAYLLCKGQNFLM